MKLLYHPLSSNSRRVLAVACQLSIRIERELVDLAAGVQRSPEFLRVNPNGKVPVLIDGELCLTESHAIALYLAEGSPLYPAERHVRADVHRWMFWSAQHFSAAIGVITRERISKHMVGGVGGPDPAVVAHGEKLVRDAAQILDDHVATRPWLVGDQPSVADLSLAAPLMHTERARLPIESFAHVRAWFGRVQALAGWRDAASLG